MRPSWKANIRLLNCLRCASDDEIIEFYQDIHKMLHGKNYHIVYLKTDDIRGNLDVIRKERSDGHGNELWFPLMMGFFNNSPYAKKNGLTGEASLVKPHDGNAIALLQE